MAASGTRVILAYLKFPTRTHIRIPSLQIHVAIGTLCRNQYRLAINHTSGYEVTVLCGHRLLRVSVHPRILPDGFSCAAVNTFQAAVLQTKLMLHIQIVDEPDFIRTIPIQIKRENRAKPDPRNNGRTKVSFP